LREGLEFGFEHAPKVSSRVGCRKTDCNVGWIDETRRNAQSTNFKLYLLIFISLGELIMAVVDTNVRHLISQYLTNPGNSDACCGKVEVAFRALQAARQVPGASLDLDLAAAEHFMFSRFMVCTGTVGVAQMTALVIGYDAKKIIDRLRGNPNADAVTGNPVSPPDADVVQWGLSGVLQGSIDHKRCNSEVTPPFWRPLEEVFGKGRGVGPY
jgi:hypothetical protein